VRRFHGHVSTAPADEMKIFAAGQINDKRDGGFVDIDVAGADAMMEDGILQRIDFESQSRAILAMNTHKVNGFSDRKARRQKQKTENCPMTYAHSGSLTSRPELIAAIIP
jgi:hypothetical protein